MNFNSDPFRSFPCKVTMGMMHNIPCHCEAQPSPSAHPGEPAHTYAMGEPCPACDNPVGCESWDNIPSAPLTAAFWWSCPNCYHNYQVNTMPEKCHNCGYRAVVIPSIAAPLMAREQLAETVRCEHGNIAVGCRECSDPLAANDAQQKAEPMTAREWTFDIDVHTHRALYHATDGLLRTCASCGEDLLHSIHIRANESEADARERIAKLYAAHCVEHATKGLRQEIEQLHDQSEAQYEDYKHAVEQLQRVEAELDTARQAGSYLIDKQIKTNREFEAELAHVTSKFDEQCKITEDVRQVEKDLRKERDAAWEALRKYGKHEYGCPAGRSDQEPDQEYPCVCGFDAALAGSPPAEGGKAE